MATRFEEFVERMEQQVRFINAQEDIAEAELARIYLRIEDALESTFLTGIPQFPTSGLTEENRILMEEALTVLDDVMRQFLAEEGSVGVQWVARQSINNTAFGAERIALTLDTLGAVDPAGTSRLRAIFENDDLERAAINAARIRLESSALSAPRRDMIEFFREAFTEGLVRGKPVVGRNSIAESLFKDGRIVEFQVQTDTGVIRMIDPEVRARTIARTELNRIENRAARSRARALRLEKVYVSNPVDNRSSQICLDAVAAGVMTPEDLEADHGFSPRHPNCRSRDIYFRESWAKAAGFTPGQTGAERATKRLEDTERFAA